MKNKYKITSLSMALALTFTSLTIAKNESSPVNRGGPVGGTITAGTANYEVANYTSTSGYSTNIAITDGVAPDHVFGSGWWFRVEGDTAETRFQVPDSESFAGDTSLVVYNDVAGRGLFSAELMAEISQPSAATAVIVKTLVIKNISAGDISVTLFNYEDFDVSGTAAADGATLTNDPDYITITDADNVEYRAGGNDLFAAAVWPAIRDFLNDAAVDDLDGSGLPFAPADFTGAYQWNAQVIPRFGEFTVQAITAINTTAPAPIDDVLFDDVIFRDGFDLGIVGP